MILPHFHFKFFSQVVFTISIDLLTLIVALLWFFTKPFWFLNASNFEPTTVILTLLSSGFTYYSIVNYFKEKKSQKEKTESFSIQQPALWIPTNHSNPQIDCVLVNNQEKKSDIEEILNKYYKTYVGKFYNVEQIHEISGTLNYRIKGIMKKPILLRIHKRITNEFALTTLQFIQRHIHERGVFSDSPLNNCLIPLPSKSGRKHEIYKDALIEVYPFAENVMHYSGESTEQVKSLAEKYGSVQHALQALEESVDVSPINGVRPNISWFKADEYLFDLIFKNNKHAIKIPHPDKFTILFNQYGKSLKEVWEEVKPTLACIKVNTKPLLHDFHPHNTFFQNDKCVLIYDYEAVSRHWSETEALAFTIHRFTREYVRILRNRGQSDVEATIPKLIKTFLKHYQVGGMSVPVNFPEQIDLAIKSSNLSKLLGIMAYNYRILEDPASRNENLWYSELVKFLAYIEEAKYYKI